VIAGPDRTRAVVEEVHGHVLDSIDAHIDDPSAMRAQLREMEREYPKRIAQVRGDLAEITQQIRQLEREKAIASRVVELADGDLAALETGLQENAGEPTEARFAASVAFHDRVLPYDRAVSRAQQIRTTRTSYSNRASDAEHDLGYLRQQAGRLEELLLSLENERAQFKAQIVALSRQVDAIARNDRLITLLDKRNRTIEECSRYEAVSLDQVSNRLAEIRSRQEAELDAIAQATPEGDYEELAKMQLAEEALDGSHPQNVHQLVPRTGAER
jgi:chromosome segregation ATPase